MLTLKCAVIQVLVILFQLREPPGRPNWLLVLFLAAYCLLFTVVYLVFKDPYIHEVNNNKRREVWYVSHGFLRFSR